MQFARWTKQFLLATLAIALLAACTSAPSKYDQIQSETTGSDAPAAVAKQATQGSAFNAFFPASEGAYEVVPSQEKQGFAEYKLNRDGKTVAMLSINDTISVPAAAAKYDGATTAIAGYPSVEQGATGTGILVNGRYQVKVLSRDDAFTATDRAEWIQKFDLQGLSQLQAGRSLQPRVAAPAVPAVPVPAT